MKKKQTKREGKKCRVPINIPRRTLVRWIHMYVPLQEMLKIPWMKQELIRRGMATKKQIATARRSDIEERKVELLTARATEVLGDEQKAKVWVRRPLRVLAGKAPAQCNIGAGLQVLGRMEHGVFA
jgi:uncharacterized protein (DUF2384 family)